jgi:ribose transport system substrate-binding protein
MQSTPNPFSSRGRRVRRRAATGLTVAAVAALAAACGGTGSTASQTEASAAPQLAEYSEVAEPGPSLDVSSVAGKTVYWIPITSQAPVFSIEQKAAEEAFAAVGVELQLCDGQANPAAVAKCVDQAIAAKAGGIIATSIPPEFAQQSFASAVRAGIPLEFVNTKDATVPAEWGKLAAALPANFAKQAEINNDLIIADSDGKANVLLVGVTDSSVTTSAYEEGMKGYLEEKCPDCEISTVETGTTTISNLASQVSAALVKNPGVEYISVEFDAFAPPVVQALRQVNKASSIKLVTMLGQLDGLQRVADGAAFADTGYSIAALGWNEADVMLRLMLGEDPRVEQHVTPIKTFTKETVEGLDLTADGWLSGAWTSEDDFRAMYRQLWGVS